MMLITLLWRIVPWMLLPSTHGLTFSAFHSASFQPKIHNLNYVQPTFLSSTGEYNEVNSVHVPNVLLVECGFGNDSHGQNATKAAIRACRNAIEFNSLSIKKMIPGGYDAMKLNVILAVPKKYQDTLDLQEVKKTFPYGDINFVVQDGGMVAPSGRVIESLGDRNDDMVIVCAAVQVGY